MERFHFDKSDKDTTPGEESSNEGLHSEDLFDQDEDAAGEKIDLMTGEKIDNSTDDGLTGLSLVEGEDETEPEDEAARWLRENDPNFKSQ